MDFLSLITNETTECCLDYILEKGYELESSLKKKGVNYPFRLNFGVAKLSKNEYRSYTIIDQLDSLASMKLIEIEKNGMKTSGNQNQKSITIKFENLREHRKWLIETYKNMLQNGNKAKNVVRELESLVNSSK